MAIATATSSSSLSRTYRIRSQGLPPSSTALAEPLRAAQSMIGNRRGCVTAAGVAGVEFGVVVFVPAGKAELIMLAYRTRANIEQHGKRRQATWYAVIVNS
jgi:hypothetical protein